MADTTTAPWTPLIEPVTLPDGYVIRELAPDEWGRLVEAGGDLTTLDPGADARAIAVLSPEGQVVGHVLIATVVHASDLYFTPAVQHHAKLGLAFLGAFLTLLQRAEIGALYATTALADPDAAARLAQLGFQRLDVALHRGRFTGGS